MNILVLDNYDSFTFNLVQYIQELLEQEVTVRRNDAISLEEVDDFDAIVLSPGPGLPAEAGIMPELIQRYAPTKPILGVCLGHQAIGEAFGADLLNLEEVYHGIETPITRVVVDAPLFLGLPDEFQAGRYHSWVVKKDSLPPELEITAVDDQGEIMAMRHRDYNVRGMQFHPESIMTPEGKQMLANFFKYCVTPEPVTV
ncbi:MAG: anthranilate synthase component II [Phaeodactylibacter xiamenensis]|uniref:Anthranilate synthase subunit II n=1 Tax=Phaeodactylibacter xiamenensis TaxID=1524460 RepID=A0A098S124_9BACT|nr:aminodeoxychorismate/anthranilate synthase component II [Phaeodactylibacter xiamenensis]KGE86079.1 anthranilate synthase subunit II [Phaeodactylibacter xiamenensis]MCR9050419.1 aminodeoxychorismate/anthranilate synthase component II [bacterium]